MAYNEQLAVRIRAVLPRRKNVTEKKMFGGLGFLMNGNMLVGIWKNELIVRLGPEMGEAALGEPFVRPMDITGKPMTGWIMISPEGIEEDEALKTWIRRAIEFVSTLPAK